jgi:hypothetical protein
MRAFAGAPRLGGDRNDDRADFATTGSATTKPLTVSYRVRV